MGEWIADYADPLLALASAVFAFLMVPTVLTQWREQNSTIPLTSSIPTVAAFIVVIAVYAALGLWITVAVEAVQTTMWAVVAAQRVAYKGLKP